MPPVENTYFFVVLFGGVGVELAHFFLGGGEDRLVLDFIHRSHAVVFLIYRSYNWI